MKSYFLFFALLLGAWSARAQDLAGAGRRDSAVKVAVMQHGRYSSFLYTINNEPITPATLKTILAGYPPSAAELRKGRSQQRLAFLLAPVFIAGIVVGGMQAARQKDVSGSAFSKAPVPYSIGLGALVGSLFFAGKSDHFGKAIEVYNRRFH